MSLCCHCINFFLTNARSSSLSESMYICARAKPCFISVHMLGGSFASISTRIIPALLQRCCITLNSLSSLVVPLQGKTKANLKLGINMSSGIPIILSLFISALSFFLPAYRVTKRRGRFLWNAPSQYIHPACSNVRFAILSFHSCPQAPFHQTA